MKNLNFYSLLVFVMAAGLTFSACSKDNDGGSGSGIITPTVKPQAGADARYVITDMSSDIDFIELTKDMHYIVSESDSYYTTKSVDEPRVVEGTYTIKDGVYYLEGWGTMVVRTTEEGVELDVTPIGATQAITLTADYEKPLITDNNAKKLCKSWMYKAFNIKMRIFLKNFDKDYTPENMDQMPADIKAFILSAVPSSMRPAIEDMDFGEITHSIDMEGFDMKRTFTTYGTVVGQNERRTEIDYWRWYDQKNGIIWIGHNLDRFENLGDKEVESIFAVSYRGTQLCLTLAGFDMQTMMGMDLPEILNKLLDASMDFSAAMIFDPAK
jgi:hypothetical protein